MESKVAARYGGKTQFASGSRWFATEDARAKGLRIEHKFSDAQYRFDPIILEVVRYRARKRGETGCLFLEFPSQKKIIVILGEREAVGLGIARPNFRHVAETKTWLVDPSSGLMGGDRTELRIRGDVYYVIPEPEFYEVVSREELT